MPIANHHPSSYRDPSGFLFYSDGILYRQVNRSFKKDFDQFIQGGLYQHLVDKDLIIPHSNITENITGSSDWYRTIRPEQLPYISYPYEWCFDMLKDAALVTLQAADEAMEFGMMLKDASGYNLQWHQGKMVFIDTLSFELFDETRPWIAYRQFCEQFFAPLALMHYLQTPLQTLFIAFPNGIPLTLTRKLLPFRSRFHLHTYLHLHLHASVSGKQSSSSSQNTPFNRKKMKNLLQSLREGIGSFSLTGRSGVWSGYYEEAVTRADYLTNKKEIILKWVDRLPVSTVLDAGANEGAFSELLHRNTSYVLSADADHYSVNQFYNQIKEQGISNIQPLVLDLANPGPGLGVNNTEWPSFVERTNTDLVLALALIHHLAIGRNIPFDRIADMFYALGQYLIIEFVPKEDEKIQVMLKQKKDIYHNYCEENFCRDWSTKFDLVDKQEIGNSGRTLYLFVRK